ncbi:MAG: membrane integrity-associated transporter subunit PqiC [Desulfovibrio sp.]|nr:membrane integrity-associated transporter subunit PqiC [Desulfovibrio sp.]
MPRILTLMALFLCLAALAGCGRSTPTNYYLLESGMPPLTADDLPPATLRVAMVEVPSYLNRNNIVSRVAGETRLILAEFHLWAEPVSNGVRRVVEETLTPPLLEAGVTVLPTGTANGGDYVLLLDVQRLDGNFNEKAVLESRWTLLDKKDAPLAEGIFAAEEMVEGSDYNMLVAAESRLVRRMGDYLAERLPPLLKRR